MLLLLLLLLLLLVLVLELLLLVLLVLRVLLVVRVLLVLLLLLLLPPNQMRARWTVPRMRQRTVQMRQLKQQRAQLGPSGCSRPRRTTRTRCSGGCGCPS